MPPSEFPHLRALLCEDEDSDNIVAGLKTLTQAIASAWQSGRQSIRDLGRMQTNSWKKLSPQEQAKMRSILTRVMDRLLSSPQPTTSAKEFTDTIFKPTEANAMVTSVKYADAALEEVIDGFTEYAERHGGDPAVISEIADRNTPGRVRPLGALIGSDTIDFARQHQANLKRIFLFDHVGKLVPGDAANALYDAILKTGDAKRPDAIKHIGYFMLHLRHAIQVIHQQMADSFLSRGIKPTGVAPAPKPDEAAPAPAPTPATPAQ